MPPMRTTPPAKAIKTERTHEENQERAYIAASRRSDRSLEARVESARRASEIHKRRTGRSLRVSEQDVINEEMYEEEDDDLPLQYRRLTAHLQTGSADFNRRLAAYLTNQVAMRTALEQMMQTAPGHGPYTAHAHTPFAAAPTMFPSPMLPQQHPVMPSPTGGAYRSAPYPPPHHANFRPPHGRAFSMVAPSNDSGSGSGAASTPAAGSALGPRRMSTPASRPSAHHDAPDAVLPDPDFASSAVPPFWPDMGPFTTTLPPETQQMLANAPGMDLNHPSYAMMMQGAEQFISDPYYPWPHMQAGIKAMPVHPAAYSGMLATLAPAALEQHFSFDGAKEPIPARTGEQSAAATSKEPRMSSMDAISTEPRSRSAVDLTPGVDQEDRGSDFPDAATGFLASGQNTPAGEGFWDNFVMDDGWDAGAETVGGDESMP